MSKDTPSPRGGVEDFSVRAPESPLEAQSPTQGPLEFELPLPVGWLDPDAAKVLRRLRHCGYTAYLVGGSVRDLLLGRYPKDFDIATSALPREVKRVFSNCRLIGRRFRLAHILFQDNIIEVATFRRDPGSAEVEEDDLDRPDDWFPRRPRRRPPGEGEDLTAAEPKQPQAGSGGHEEFDGSELELGLSEGPAFPEGFPGSEQRRLPRGAEARAEDLAAERAEPFDGEGESEDERDDGGAEDLLIRSDNVFGTPQEDALRRDFTINALFFDVSTLTLIDWAGGFKDIEARVIRTIGIPEVRFREDPVRMLRAIKFAAALRFTVEPRTWAALCLVAPDISRAAAPRILEEIFRMMRGGASTACFRLMTLGGLLKHILPELEPLVALELAADAAGAATGSNPLRLHMGAADVTAGTSSDELAPPALLPDEAARERDGEGPALASVLGYLHALDQVDQTGLPLPNHLLLSLLSLVPVFRMLKLEAGNAISDQVFRKAGFLLEEMGARLRIARRDRERARLVLLGLTKILWRSERGTSLAALTRKSYFAESMVLYGLHVLALGSGLEDLRRLVKRMTITPEVGRVLEVIAARFPEHPAPAAHAVAAHPAPFPEGGEGSGRSKSRRRRRRRKRGEGASMEGGDGSADAATRTGIDAGVSGEG